LHWPHHWPRTRKFKRRDSKFAKHSFGQIRDALSDELRRMGAKRVLLSTDIPVTQAGLPYSGRREPEEPGAAVYFAWRGEPYVIACDTYVRVWENIKAITKTIEAMRAIERHGASQLLERVFMGFSALPPAGSTDAPEASTESWWTTLGFDDGVRLDLGRVVANPDSPLRGALLRTAETMYRFKIQDAHPDRPSGSNEAMTRLNLAIAEARKQLS
jgi:hypothetical protein